MSVAIEIRPAKVDDAGSIVEVIRDGFDDSLLNLFIYGCPGIARYVGEQIAIRRSGGDTAHTVACSGERVVGCVEMRRFPAQLFLNYISVRTGFRSRDLGKRLLGASIRESRDTGQSRMSLDVLERNVGARRWYESLGFEYDGSCSWWEVPLPETGPAGAAMVSEYPQSLASHREFGFSMFRIVTGSGEYPVGRLGDDWFRVVGSEALADPAVPAALRGLDPSRRILALLPEGGELPSAAPPGRRLAVTRRMSADLEGLARRLP